jgi:phage shock protein B
MEFFIGLGLLIAIPLLAIALLIQVIRAASRNNDELLASEAKLLQGLQKQLTGMEERIETLETLLLEEREKNRQGNGQNKGLSPLEELSTREYEDAGKRI